MSYWVTYIINNFVQIALIVFMAGEVGKLKKGFLFNYLSIMGVWIVLNILVFVVLKPENGADILNLMQTVYIFAMLYIATEGSRHQKFRAVVANCITAILTETSVRIIIITVYGIDLGELYVINTLRTVISILALEIYFAWIMIILFLYRMKDESYRGMRSICLINAAIAVLFGAISIIYNIGGADKMNSQDIFVNQITHCLITVLLVVLYLTMKSNLEKERNEERLTAINGYIEQTHEYYKLAEQRYEETARIRHDIRNQVQAIEYLMSENNFDEAGKSLEALRERYGETNMTIYSNVPIVNVIIALKINECAKNGIRTEIVLRDCDKLPFDNYEMCSVFSNIMDNAINACTLAEKGHIMLKSQVFGDTYVLKTENSLPEKHTADYKLKRKGYGLEIIKSIALKYNGVFSTERSADSFICQLSIPINHE